MHAGRTGETAMPVSAAQAHLRESFDGVRISAKNRRWWAKAGADAYSSLAAR